MKARSKWILRSPGILVILLCVFGGYYLWRVALIGTAYKAKELPTEFDITRLHDVFNAAFSEPDPDRLRRTRAIVVVYDGRIIAERYAQGFTHETPYITAAITLKYCSNT